MPSLSPMIGPLPQDDARPLYLQLQHLLRRGIRSGALPPEYALPSERQLCDEFGISRVTVRKAVNDLVSDGLLIRVQGSGTFVAGAARERERVEKSFSKLTSFSEDMLARGLEPSSIWLARTEGSVTPDEGLALALSPGSKVYRFKRIRLADGEPMALEKSTIPADCLPSADSVKDSLYAALRKNGRAPERALQRLRAIAFEGEQAETLGVPVGHPGLLIERRAFLKDGRAAEFTLSYYRGDRYDFMAELGDS